MSLSNKNILFFIFFFKNLVNKLYSENQFDVKINIIRNVIFRNVKAKITTKKKKHYSGSDQHTVIFFFDERETI